MADAATCGTCSRAIPVDAPAGACPRCTSATPQAASGDGMPTAAEFAATIDGFEILGVLGRGGMGIVFKARQKSLERTVAIKVLPPAMAAAPGFADRFRRESTAMARLAHPNIVAVHEYGVAGAFSFLLLEYVEGVNLRAAMATGRVGAREALAIVPQICDALTYTHARGVVHRDIKPENVLIRPDGRVKIADFGLAKLAARVDGDASLTATGQVLGTLRYMAPEQWERPNDVDFRADIYSLGVLFYEMLTGELPIGRFEPPSRKSGLDVRLDEVVLRSLERDRERRWQSAEEVRARLGEIASGPDVASSIVRPTAPLPRQTPPQSVAADTEEEPGPGVYAQYSALVVDAARRSTDVEFHAGDMTAMPFPDASVEKLVASLSIHNVDDGELRARAIREIMRVLSPGGGVAVIDFRRGERYADELRACGMQQVEISPVSVWLALPARVVTARLGSPRS